MANSYQSTGLAANTLYYYKIRARAGDVYSGYSSVVSATTLSFFDVVLADGATIAFKFNESSGNILNYGSGGSAYDLTQVSSAVTRSQTGISGPDTKSILCSASNGSTPTYGHMQGARPTLSGLKTLSVEMILKVPVNVTKTSLDMNSTDVGNSATGFYTDSTNFRASIAITGQPIQDNILTSSNAIASAFKHVAYTWDGAHFVGYYQGAQIFSTAIGGGSTGIFDGATSHLLAIGGFVNDGTVNAATNADFAALYFTQVLTPTQVAAHFALSGC